MTTPRHIPFVLPYPGNGWVHAGSELSTVRNWARSKILGHARRTGCTLEHLYGWAYDAREVDGRPAVAVTAVLRPLPTVATEVARLHQLRKTQQPERHGE